jgi:hypothetical protein
MSIHDVSHTLVDTTLRVSPGQDKTFTYTPPNLLPSRKRGNKKSELLK